MYNQGGSAAEYVCLPHDPHLITNVAPTNPYGATTHIYGAEYEDNVFGSNVFNYDVPCAAKLKVQIDNTHTMYLSITFILL
jgi:hypothetical protein